MKTVICLLILVVLAGCGKRNGPVELRMQTVHEVECPHKTFYVYVPDNTIGFRFDSEGRELSGIPDCLSRVVGVSDGVSGEIQFNQ